MIHPVRPTNKNSEKRRYGTQTCKQKHHHVCIPDFSGLPPFCEAVFNQASMAADPDGSSWAQAFPSLSMALKSNLTGKKEIWVTRGTYYPTDTADREASFCLVPGIGIYSGFTGDELLLFQRDSNRNITVLSGEIGDPQLLSDNSYHVVTGADDAVIDGFVIRDGYAVPIKRETDAGVYYPVMPESLTGTENLGTVTGTQPCTGGGCSILMPGHMFKTALSKATMLSGVGPCIIGCPGTRIVMTYQTRATVSL